MRTVIVSIAKKSLLMVSVFSVSHVSHISMQSVRTMMAKVGLPVTTFLAASTKGNIKFFCNTCLTNLEIGMAETDTQKIITLENKYSIMENKLDEIKSLLMKKEQKEVSWDKDTPQEQQVK